MHPVEVKEIMSSFVVLVDRREHKTEKAERRYKALGVPWEAATLSYGDYAGNVKLPGGTWLYDTSKTLKPMVVVERKMSLSELAYCLGVGRKRFQAEMERAAARGARVYLVVENGSHDSILRHKYRSKVPPQTINASLRAWEARFDIHVEYCSDLTSGELIKEILWREMKEFLTDITEEELEALTHANKAT